MEKSLTIRIEELKHNIANLINTSNLHPYILDSIIKQMYEEIHSVYMQDINQEFAKYNSAMQAENNKTEEIVNNEEAE